MITYTFFAFVCSLMYSVSSVLCKYGLQHQVNIRSLSVQELAKFLSRNRIWLLGVLLAVLANLIMIQIQSRLDISIVYSILNFSYIFVLVLGHYFLKESLNSDQWLGVVVVAMGTLVILGISQKNTGHPTDILNLLRLTGSAILVIASLLAVAYYNRQINYEALFATGTGFCFGLVEIYLKATTNMASAGDSEFSVLSASSMREFVSVWPFFVMFAFGALGWLFLQITYSHGNISITVPIVAVTQRVVSMFGGYYVYDEVFGLIKLLGAATIVLGIVILVFSILRIEEVKTV